MKKHKLCVLFIMIFGFFSKIGYSARNNRQRNIEALIEKANHNRGEEPENFDEEYVHDEAFIQLKTKELKEKLSNAYEQIDNIILFESLMNAFGHWKGTKYRWGGDSKDGIDCSALTRRIYRAVFNGYELPRVSVDQIKRGKIVSKENLKPGDILFFRPRNSVNHTAVYVGNSLFINASSSNGVILSSLENSYWKQYFKFGVRVHAARER
ncbi:C40 family peptidase [Sneathia sanguinegens]|uniref:C40 family peptidase n=1 Tax=Sneathia sanguinegens TaxID=40543 RepID=UPI0008346308|nr:NlpC/P60 family protein [Sneathia sanguinegens]MDU4652814.1 NlpC/P60 family protein [Sneathia sanguinegens]MDU7497190.1 NlpC/P60 family protein [Sneathia sanguinegens]